MKIIKKYRKLYWSRKIFKLSEINLMKLYNILKELLAMLIDLLLYLTYNPNLLQLSPRQMTKRERAESLSKALSKSEEQQNVEQAEEIVKADQKKEQNSNSLSKLLPSKISDFGKYKSTNQKDLPQQFFKQEVVELAKALLGKIFVRKTDKGLIKAVIVETQAYKAPEDKACHAYNNKKTQRTKYFWLDGGHLYIYTIYMPSNVCLNVVAGNEGQPEAVLVRAVQPIEGLQLVKELRNIKSPKVEQLSNGPGKVGQALGIDMKKMNGQFKIIDGGITGFSVGVSRRVNIDYAEQWIDKPWRFYVEGNKFVSKVNFDAAPKKKVSKQKK